MSNFLRDDHPYYGDADYEDNYLPDNDPMPGGDADGMYDDILDDGILETLIVLGLAGALVFLIYYRNQRQMVHRRNEEVAAAGHQEVPQGPPPAEDRGLFPQPGDPNFNDWVAGGIGH